MGDDAHAAVLRLHRVVADPHAAVPDLGAALLGLARTGDALVGLVDEAAVGPDGVLALDRVTVGLVAAGVQDLEVVDVAVRLVEVAVVVGVVAVPLVERLELGDHRCLGPAGGELVGVPLVDTVADQVLAVVADDVRADVGIGVVEVAGPAVAGLVVLHLDPVGDGAVDAVAAGGLPLVVLPDRLGLASCARSATGAEVEVLEERAAVVGLPHGRVVLRAVRLGDLVVQRAVPRHRAGGGGVDVLVRVLRVAGVAELREYDEDAVGLLARQLDVLVLSGGLAGGQTLPVDRCGSTGARHLHDRAGPALLRLGGAVEDLGQRLLTKGAALHLELARVVVGPDDVLGVPPWAHRWRRRCGTQRRDAERERDTRGNDKTEQLDGRASQGSSTWTGGPQVSHRPRIGKGP